VEARGLAEGLVGEAFEDEADEAAGEHGDEEDDTSDEHADGLDVLCFAGEEDEAEDSHGPGAGEDGGGAGLNAGDDACKPGGKAGLEEAFVGDEDEAEGEDRECGDLDPEGDGGGVVGGVGADAGDERGGIGDPGAEDEDVAVGEVDELEDAVDHRVAERDERVEAADGEGVHEGVEEAVHVGAGIVAESPGKGLPGLVWNVNVWGAGK